jgi:hypothetical protein
VEGLWPELFEDLRSEVKLTADFRGLVFADIYTFLLTVLVFNHGLGTDSG